MVHSLCTLWGCKLYGTPAVSDLVNASPYSTACTSARLYWLFCLKLRSPGLTFPVYSSSRMCIPVTSHRQQTPRRERYPRPGRCCIFLFFCIMAFASELPAQAVEMKNCRCGNGCSCNGSFGFPYSVFSDYRSKRNLNSAAISCCFT